MVYADIINSSSVSKSMIVEAMYHCILKNVQESRNLPCHTNLYRLNSTGYSLILSSIFVYNHIPPNDMYISIEFNTVYQTSFGFFLENVKHVVCCIFHLISNNRTIHHGFFFIYKLLTSPKYFSIVFSDRIFSLLRAAFTCKMNLPCRYCESGESGCRFWRQRFTRHSRPQGVV